MSARIGVRHPTRAEVAVSAELFAPGGHGVELCYQTFGDPDGDPLLLVMGLGGPMTWWDPELCRLLAARGFYVIRYDNRDTGRSTQGAGPGHPADAGARVRRPAGCGRRTRCATSPTTRSACSTTSASRPPTSCGVSMGGMIAQTMAIEQPAPGAVADQHHVDDRQALGRLAAPAPAAGAARPPRPRPDGVRRGQPRRSGR